ncbi:MAG: zinc metallopeptidase [Proteobacteria bacterium]|nr:zinc metallopeptidase [Pseudomonadota bacterium]NOG59895.1 zinc metallopeptidase [Pseudomonadota bacterium]
MPALVIVTLLIIVFFPQFWVKRVIKKYDRNIEELPGTGGELAKHLINRFELKDITVEQTENGNDHYDPQSKTIRLSESNHDGKSLTAITIAAHEFGHALQHHTNYKPLLLRTKLATTAAAAEKIASFILISLPFAMVLVKLPSVGAVMLLAGLTIMCLPVILHLFTLPVEFDASFNRALPILSEGKYIPEQAMPIARKILTAAALTYVSASLASLLNFYRWLSILRR